MAVLGVASLGIVAIDVWQRDRVLAWAGGENEDRMIQAMQWLAWIGRESPSLHVHVARALGRSDRPDAAIAEFQRSLELHPTPAAWVGLGQVYAKEGRWTEASGAFAAVLSENPDHMSALAGASHAWLRLGRPDLARKSLEHARSLAPGDARIERLLQRAIAAEGVQQDRGL
jgi:tetratricopeptide (TPR) repeat protein